MEEFTQRTQILLIVIIAFELDIYIYIYKYYISVLHITFIVIVVRWGKKARLEDWI